MISLGMWSCQWRELRPIFFGGKDGQASDTIAAAGTDGPGAQGAVEHDVGFTLDIGAGGAKKKKAKDQSGSYEMVSRQDAGG